MNRDYMIRMMNSIKGEKGVEQVKTFREANILTDGVQDGFIIDHENGERYHVVLNEEGYFEHDYDDHPANPMPKNIYFHIWCDNTNAKRQEGCAGNYGY